ncbi:MAG: NAD(P)/FAD-dependent oxidoreductase [Dehalococcoidia bacterium]|nr:NAD(P)/FAD-dependent oxidoreductase [Dehalococcoidia bacterium]
MVAVPREERPVGPPAPVRSLRKTALVLGGGYGGITAVLRLANHLDRRQWQVVLVDRNPYHLLETRLHEAAAHGAEITIPLARIIRGRGITLLLASVTGIDLENRTVLTDRGPVQYDALVLALGSTTNFYGIPGLREHAFELKELEDAINIRARVNRQFALAAAEPSEAVRRDLLRFVVGGGGLTGVELAAELADRATTLAREHEINRAEVEVMVVEMGPTVLPTLDERLRRRAEATLREKGVVLRTGVRVIGMEDNRVQLDPGGDLATGLMVWTGGVRAPDLFIGERPLTGPQGRLVVDRYLRLLNHDEVFVVGDLALAKDPRTDRVVPAAAQFALQQGDIAGQNLAAWTRQQPMREYHPKVLGEVVSLGQHLAVGWVALGWMGRLKLVGFVAALVKRAIWERHLWLLWRQSRNRVFVG